MSPSAKLCLALAVVVALWIVVRFLRARAYDRRAERRAARLTRYRTIREDAQLAAQMERARKQARTHTPRDAA